MKIIVQGAEKHLTSDICLRQMGFPLCPECKVPIRPGVNLIGDRMSSARITMAAAELAKADTLLILGEGIWKHRLFPTCFPISMAIW